MSGAKSARSASRMRSDGQGMEGDNIARTRSFARRGAIGYDHGVGDDGRRELRERAAVPDPYALIPWGAGVASCGTRPPFYPGERSLTLHRATTCAETCQPGLRARYALNQRLTRVIYRRAPPGGCDILEDARFDSAPGMKVFSSRLRLTRCPPGASQSMHTHFSKAL